MSKFKHLAALTNENCIQEEMRNVLNSGNGCYLTIEKLVSSCLLYIRVYLKIENYLV